MSKEEYYIIMSEALDQIDRELAERETPIFARSLHATIEFVRRCVVELRTDDGKTVIPSDSGSNILEAEWFKPLFRDVETWYRHRYGSQVEMNAEHAISGVVCVFNTPFALEVPVIVSTPGKPGETIWLQIPDQVLESEDSLSWLTNGPDFTNASKSDGMKARRHANEVACALRFIHVNLLGTEMPGKLGELGGGILSNLERAAELIVLAQTHALKHAHWNIQMACEHALKALLQQRSGTSQETHDLFVLYDQMPSGTPSFGRTLLSKLPNWERMASLRYGGGGHVSIGDAYLAYRTALKIVKETVGGLEKRWSIGGFEIRRAPWAD